MNLVQKFFKPKETNNEKDNKLAKLKEINNLIMLIYLKLNLKYCQDSYYQKYPDNASRIFALRDDINKLQSLIAEFLGVVVSALDILASNYNYLGDLAKYVDIDQVDNLLNFDQLVLSQLKMESDEDWYDSTEIYQKFWM
jgi:hypothetical protein